MFPSKDTSKKERAEGRAAEAVAAPDVYLKLIYVRFFLHEVGEGLITERVFEGN